MRKYHQKLFNPFNIANNNINSTLKLKRKILTVCPRYAALKLGTRVCALPCHLPVSPGHTNGVSKLGKKSRLRITFITFHYVMVEIVPTVHLAAHAKSCTMYGRQYGHKSKFFWLDGLLLFCIIMRLRCVSSAINMVCIQQQKIYTPLYQWKQSYTRKVKYCFVIYSACNILLQKDVTM